MLLTIDRLERQKMSNMVVFNNNGRLVLEKNKSRWSRRGTKSSSARGSSTMNMGELVLCKCFTAKGKVFGGASQMLFRANNRQSITPYLFSQPFKHLVGDGKGWATLEPDEAERGVVGIAVLHGILRCQTTFEWQCSLLEWW